MHVVYIDYSSTLCRIKRENRCPLDIYNTWWKHVARYGIARHLNRKSELFFNLEIGCKGVYVICNIESDIDVCPVVAIQYYVVLKCAACSMLNMEESVCTVQRMGSNIV